MKDTDFLFLTSLLRAREVRMLKEEKINRMLEAPEFDDAAKLLVDCGYTDMSGMNAAAVEDVLLARRNSAFSEIAALGYAGDLLDLFRIKYDYHNIKVLVKASGSSSDASYLLSDSGRIETDTLRDCIVSGSKNDLPPHVSAAIDSASGVLARTSDPQLADIQIDKAYFDELTELSKRINSDFISGYVALMIDSANLRITVRSKRTGRNRDFLEGSLLQGGNVTPASAVSAYETAATAPFMTDALKQAVLLAEDAVSGGAQTLFELACDNAVLRYVTNTVFVSFGTAPVVSYLAKLEWELTTVRMILTGKMTGIPSDVIRERLRVCHV